MTPPTPIDLDLVELRCKLRGWECRRESRSSEMGGNVAWVVADHFRSVVWEDADPSLAFASRTSSDDIKALTAPRLTLADIIADPGEGWTVELEDKEFPDGGHRFGWRAQHGAYFLTHGAIVVRKSDGRVLDAVGCASQGAERIAAHRAVTDLLIRLAEVSDV